jgi:hypothetical protein
MHVTTTSNATHTFYYAMVTELPLILQYSRREAPRPLSASVFLGGAQWRLRSADAGREADGAGRANCGCAVAECGTCCD